MNYDIIAILNLSYYMPMIQTHEKKCPFNKLFLYVYFIKTDILTFY